MPLFYCLAETVVNGEIIIQENSVTYSASASAFASANTSFEAAAKVATIDSNTAAIVAARNTVNAILIEYAYVLADVNITEMINNSLKTTVSPIIPIVLESIASTVDGRIYILNKDTIIKSNEYLLIPSGKKLIVDVGIYKFENFGLLALGEESTATNKCVGCKTSNKATATTCTLLSLNPCCAIVGQCIGGLRIISTSTSGPSATNYNIQTVSQGCCLEIDKGVTLTNYNSFTNNGCVSLLGGTFKNSYSSAYGTVGSLNNGAGGLFFSNPLSS